MAARLIMVNRKWVNTDLKGTDVGRFREYCRDCHINFETSDAGYGYTHFECLMSDDEKEKANAYIDTL